MTNSFSIHLLVYVCEVSYQMDLPETIYPFLLPDSEYGQEVYERIFQNQMLCEPLGCAVS
mgnify:CR=1 FL=1